MALRARHVSDHPETFFRQNSDEGPYLRVGDILLRYRHSHTYVFSDLIRFATKSKWSHSSLVFLEPDPAQGSEAIFLVDVTTKKGAFVASWTHEMAKPDAFTEGLKRPRLDWYAETPDEKAAHALDDPEDVHGIEYLRQVRDVALGQLHTHYDGTAVWELAALYMERLAKQRLKAVPQIAELAASVEHLLENRDEANSVEHGLHFICSGLVQYSYFEALRLRILHNLDIPQNREAALNNLHNMHQIIFRDDPDNVISRYIEEVQSDHEKLAEPLPEEVLNLLRTATPADFNNSSKLAWRYIINKDYVWQIYEATGNQEAEPQSKDEQEILALMKLDTGPLA
jgi:hypothetical protein